MQLSRAIPVLVLLAFCWPSPWAHAQSTPLPPASLDQAAMAFSISLQAAPPANVALPLPPSNNAAAAPPQPPTQRPRSHHLRNLLIIVAIGVALPVILVVIADK